MRHRLGFRFILSFALAINLVAAVPMVAAASVGRLNAKPLANLNPWNCQVAADNPHISTHVPGTAAAHGEVDCTSTPQNLELDIHLSSQWCFFFICNWTNRGNNSVYYSNWQRTWIGLDVGAICNNSNSTVWQLQASSTAWLTGGTQYKATISNTQTVACGP
jgi:hypothetical protein